jgi:hypothetical protein
LTFHFSRKFSNLKWQKNVLIAVKSGEEIIPLIQPANILHLCFSFEGVSVRLKAVCRALAVRVHALSGSAQQNSGAPYRLVVSESTRAFIPSGALFAAA